MSVPIVDASRRLLRLSGASVDFGGVHALTELDLQLQVGEIVGLIGPNGAGKTTAINVLSGYVPQHSGRTQLDEQEINSWAPYRRARAGVARTFQGARLFANLSVSENLCAGALGVGASGAKAARTARRLLERAELADRACQLAGVLSHGESRKVAVLRALAGSPTFLLLDEPAAGLNESESDELQDFLRGIRDDFGCGLLVVEHDMRLVMSLCDRLQVLDYGRTIFQGTPERAQQDPAVLTAYLGTGS
jgi:branched-chain amino acid transport system ATP-binding protein